MRKHRPNSVLVSYKPEEGKMIGSLLYSAGRKEKIRLQPHFSFFLASRGRPLQSLEMCAFALRTRCQSHHFCRTRPGIQPDQAESNPPQSLSRLCRCLAAQAARHSRGDAKYPRIPPRQDYQFYHLYLMLKRLSNPTKALCRL